MANLSDYVQWRGDLSFEVRPFNAIDALVLCQLSYLNFSDIVPARFDGGITLRDAAHIYAADSTRGTPEEFGVFINPLTADLLKAAAETERFGSLLLKEFVNEVNRTADKQFAALTAVLPAGDACVVYRGTDDSIIGWKEDCLLCLPDAVPSHAAAVQYLSAAAAACGTEKLSIAGHSKGGNLALYAAGTAAASIRERIDRVFCFDGPGFAFDIEQWDGFQAILPLLLSLSLPLSAFCSRIFRTIRLSKAPKPTPFGSMMHFLGKLNGMTLYHISKGVRRRAILRKKPCKHGFPALMIMSGRNLLRHCLR